VSIVVKRIHEPVSRADGYRVLVDRLWPRGVKKAQTAIDLWLREVAPSTKLRQWFGHDPARWGEFCRRYHEELREKAGLLAPLTARARKGPVTLLYSARDEAHNQAVALAAYLNTH
jgi:uncharacterized protein YeaO (DUF488 family)